MELTSGATAVFAAQMTLSFGEEIVIVAVTSAPAELVARHAFFVVTPATEITTTRSAVFRLLALVCANRKWIRQFLHYTDSEQLAS